MFPSLLLQFATGQTYIVGGGAAIFAVVLDAEIPAWSAGVVTGREDDASIEWTATWTRESGKGTRTHR